MTIGSDDPMTTETRVAPPKRSPRSRIDRPREEAALALLERGERTEALKILMACYATPITTFALRIVRDRELAKDVRQQVFLEAFQRIDTFERRSSLWSWLCAIACHRCLDELKRIRRRMVDSLDVLEGLAEPSEPLMDADRVAKQRALERCLAKLSPPMRTQVLMRCFLGLSYAEIGEVVGASPGTVQVRISRTLPELRRCLGKQGMDR